MENPDLGDLYINYLILNYGIIQSAHELWDYPSSQVFSQYI